MTRTPRRSLARLIAVSGAATLGLALLAPGAALASPATDGTNPWLSFRVADMAHSGGENEAPTNTMYAFKRAIDLGADMLELDVQSTKDKKLVVLHNATIDETTDGHGFVRKMKLKKVRGFDAAHWFVPRQGTTHDAKESAYKLRGARYGETKVKGYQKKDFRIPTLKEVFKAFPDTPINIEIKGTADDDLASYQRTGGLLASFLKKSGRTDVIVTSFNDTALAQFHTLAPQISLAPGRQGLLDYYLKGVKPIEGTVALQVPVTYSGFTIMTKAFVAKAHADGYAVHVWFSGSAPDDAATYKAMIATCADGLMVARPTLFEKILDQGGIERPGKPGVSPCTP